MVNGRVDPNAVLLPGGTGFEEGQKAINPTSMGAMQRAADTLIYSLRDIAKERARAREAAAEREHELKMQALKQSNDMAQFILGEVMENKRLQKQLEAQQELTIQTNRTRERIAKMGIVGDLVRNTKGYSGTAVTVQGAIEKAKFMSGLAGAIKEFVSKTKTAEAISSDPTLNAATERVKSMMGGQARVPGTSGVTAPGQMDRLSAPPVPSGGVSPQSQPGRSSVSPEAFRTGSAAPMDNELVALLKQQRPNETQRKIQETRLQFGAGIADGIQKGQRELVNAMGWNFSEALNPPIVVDLVDPQKGWASLWDTISQLPSAKAGATGQMMRRIVEAFQDPQKAIDPALMGKFPPGLVFGTANTLDNIAVGLFGKAQAVKDPQLQRAYEGFAEEIAQLTPRMRQNYLRAASGYMSVTPNDLEDFASGDPDRMLAAATRLEARANQTLNGLMSLDRAKLEAMIRAERQMDILDQLKFYNDALESIYTGNLETFQKQYEEELRKRGLLPD